MKWRNYLLPLLALVAMIIFVAYPVITVVLKSLNFNGITGPGNYTAIFTDPQFLHIVWQSAAVAVAAAILSTLSGLIIALTVFKTRLPLRSMFGVSAVLPMIIPGFVSTLAFIFLFGRNGVITYHLFHFIPDVYSWKSVLIIQTVDFTTITFLIISAVLWTVDSQAEDAARSLGASEWRVLTDVTLPLIRPGIIAALLLVFMRSMADFGTPQLVGGRFSTLASASYNQLIGSYNIGMSSSLNTVLLVFCLIAFWLYERSRSGESDIRMQGQGSRQKPLELSRPVKWAMWGICTVFTVYVLMLIVSVFLAATTRYLGSDYTLTMEYFKSVTTRGLNGILNTFWMATLTAVIMSFVGIALAYLLSRIEFRGRRIIDMLATLPFAIPGTLMGVGYILAFNKSPLLLTGTLAIVLALIIIRELPLGLRSGTSVLVQQDRSIEDASASLGSSRIGTFFRIILPLARPALLISAAYAFVSSVQTLGAIIFVVTPGTKLLSIDVFEEISKGDIGFAASLSVIMVILSAAGLLVIYFLSQKENTGRWFRRLIMRTPT